MLHKQVLVKDGAAGSKKKGAISSGKKAAGNSAKPAGPLPQGWLCLWKEHKSGQKVGRTYKVSTGSLR